MNLNVELTVKNSQNKSHINGIIRLHCIIFRGVDFRFADPVAGVGVAGVLGLAGVEPGVEPREDAEVIVGGEAGAERAVPAGGGQGDWLWGRKRRWQDGTDTQ